MLFNARIGAIEIVGNAVRLAVIKTGAKRPVILELHQEQAIYDAPEERRAALVQAVKVVLARVRRAPAAYVLCANSMYAIVRLISIPFKGKRRVAAAVPFELEPFLAFPLEELLVDFEQVGEFGGATQVLALGMRRAFVEEQLSILAEVGIVPDRMTLDGVALTELWRRGQRGLRGLNAVLHVRDSGSCLAVTFNKTLAYLRHLPLTAAEFSNEPARAAREIQNTLRAFLASWPAEGEIAAIHISGLTLDAPEREALAEALHVPVNEILLLSKAKGNATTLASARVAGHNTWEAVIGGAMGAANGLYQIDFSRTEQRWQAALPSVLKHVVFSSFLALAALLGWGYYYHHAAASLHVKAATLQGEVDQLSSDIEAMAEKGFGPDTDMSAFTAPSLIAVLRDIAERMPESRVSIQEIQISPPDQRMAWLTIKGTTKDPAAFNEVFAGLQRSALYRVEQNPQLSTSNGVTSFTIHATSPEEPNEEAAT